MEKFNYIQEGGKNYLKSEEISEMNYITKMLIHNDIPALAEAKFIPKRLGFLKKF